MTNQKPKNNFHTWVKYTTLGTEMGGAIFICTILGYQIDKWLENELYWSTIVGLFLGLAVAFNLAYKNLK